MFLNNYHCILLNYTLVSQIYIFCIIYLSIIYITYTLSKWHTILNMTPLFLSSALFEASSSSQVTVVVPLTTMYASLNHINLTLSSKF